MPFTVLVVCQGNLCRSPLAERLLRARLDGLLAARAAEVSLSSAGARAWAGHSMDQSAAAELVRLGGDPSGFIATQLTRQMVDASDLVLAATRELRSRVLEEAPRALRRTFTIREFAALAVLLSGERDLGPAGLVARAAGRRGDATAEDHDIPDPIGQSERLHRQVADLLNANCTAIARVLAAPFC